ncbi:MAG: hypothetical protein ACE5JF_08860 [Anaerolineales bacterium]
MYQIILYLHVASSLGFFLFHGATASVSYGLKREQGRKSVQMLLKMRESSGVAGGISMTVMFISGIVLSFMGRFWSETWVWISIVIFVVILLVMGGYGRNNFDRVSYLFDPETYKTPRDKKGEAPIPASDEELAAEQAKGRPIMLTVTGMGALVLILWLMMFKPF